MASAALIATFQASGCKPACRCASHRHPGFPYMDRRDCALYNVGMALPGLVRVTAVAKVLGIDRATARSALGSVCVRRPRESATSGEGPWYCTIEDAVGLVDLLLPKVLQRRANARARRRLEHDARLTGSSGPLVRYVQGGTGAESTGADSAPTSHPTKITGTAT